MGITEEVLKKDFLEEVEKFNTKKYRPKILRKNIASDDATVVEKLEKSGAIIIGKTALVEFAFGATGLNPHYPRLYQNIHPCDE